MKRKFEIEDEARIQDPTDISTEGRTADAHRGRLVRVRGPMPPGLFWLGCCSLVRTWCVARGFSENLVRSW